MDDDHICYWGNSQEPSMDDEEPPDLTVAIRAEDGQIKVDIIHATGGITCSVAEIEALFLALDGSLPSIREAQSTLRAQRN